MQSCFLTSDASNVSIVDGVVNCISLFSCAQVNVVVCLCFMFSLMCDVRVCFDVCSAFEVCFAVCSLFLCVVYFLCIGDLVSDFCCVKFQECL